MTKTLRLINISEHPDYDEIQLREDDIGPDEDTTGWITIDDGHGKKFPCSLMVVEAILFIGRPHTEDDP